MTQQWRPLVGKAALVTGAGRGLGYGVARALGRAGASVCASDIDGGELLVPLVRDAERSVDVEARRIDVDLRFLGEEG